MQSAKRLRTTLHITNGPRNTSSVTTTFSASSAKPRSDNITIAKADKLEKIISHFKNKIAEGNGHKIQKYCVEHPLLRVWLTGKEINIGSTNHPNFQKITIKELIDIFEILVQCNLEEIIKIIWSAKDNEPLRNWYRGESVSYKSAERLNTIQGNVLKNFKSAINHSPFVAERMALNNRNLDILIAKEKDKALLVQLLKSKLNGFFKGYYLKIFDDLIFLREVKTELEKEKNEDTYTKTGYDELTKRINLLESESNNNTSDNRNNKGQNFFFAETEPVSNTPRLTNSEAIDSKKWNTILARFNKKVRKGKIQDILQEWDNEPLIAKWFYGESIKVTGQNEQLIKINIEDLALLFGKLKSLQLNKLINEIWHAIANQELRDWGRGADIQCGDQNNPKTIKTAYTELFKYGLRKNNYLAYQIWHDNIKLHDLFKKDRTLITAVLRSNIDATFKQKSLAMVEDEILLQQIEHDFINDHDKYKRNNNWKISLDFLQTHIKQLKEQREDPNVNKTNTLKENQQEIPRSPLAAQQQTTSYQPMEIDEEEEIPLITKHARVINTFNAGEDENIIAEQPVPREPNAEIEQQELVSSYAKSTRLEPAYAYLKAQNILLNFKSSLEHNNARIIEASLNESVVIDWCLGNEVRVGPNEHDVEVILLPEQLDILKKLFSLKYYAMAQSILAGPKRDILERWYQGYYINLYKTDSFTQCDDDTLLDNFLDLLRARNTLFLQVWNGRLKRIKISREILANYLSAVLNQNSQDTDINDFIVAYINEINDVSLLQKKLQAIQTLTNQKNTDTINKIKILLDRIKILTPDKKWDDKFQENETETVTENNNPSAENELQSQQTNNGDDPCVQGFATTIVNSSPSIETNIDQPCTVQNSTENETVVTFYLPNPTQSDENVNLTSTGRILQRIDSQPFAVSHEFILPTNNNQVESQSNEQNLPSNNFDDLENLLVDIDPTFLSNIIASEIEKRDLDIFLKAMQDGDLEQIKQYYPIVRNLVIGKTQSLRTKNGITEVKYSDDALARMLSDILSFEQWEIAIDMWTYNPNVRAPFLKLSNNIPNYERLSSSMIILLNFQRFMQPNLAPIYQSIWATHPELQSVIKGGAELNRFENYVHLSNVGLITFFKNSFKTKDISFIAQIWDQNEKLQSLLKTHGGDETRPNIFVDLLKLILDSLQLNSVENKFFDEFLQLISKSEIIDACLVEINQRKQHPVSNSQTLMKAESQLLIRRSQLIVTNLMSNMNSNNIQNESERLQSEGADPTSFINSQQMWHSSAGTQSVTTQTMPRFDV